MLAFDHLNETIDLKVYVPITLKIKQICIMKTLLKAQSFELHL